MAKAEASVEELVSMTERGELRLPEIQRQQMQKVGAGETAATWQPSRISIVNLIVSNA